jgi:transcriptional regulator with PAS, ATPase and Fis domain
MAPALQAKLLRVLQEKEIHPLGAPAPVPVDVRVIAATHRNLEALCAEERFRRDLYYRLNVISVRVPPLRERPEDLLPLVAHFLTKHGRRLGREGAATVSLEVMELFRRYSWPGNVRELENAIERALVLGRGLVIRVEDLPDDLKQGLQEAPGPQHVRLLADMEREQIIKALRSVRGNKAAAARLLGVDRKTLYRKIELYGIRHP